MSVPHALLALLSQGSKYGLQLQQEFESRTGEVWPLNVGQVYTTLQRLERDGLVESSDGTGRQRIFQITQTGKRELTEWLETSPDTLTPRRDELVIKILVALAVPGVDVHDVLQAHRRQLVETMQRYTHIKGELDESEVALPLVLDAELFRLDGVVRWLDATDARLVRASSANEDSAAKSIPARALTPRDRRE
jgi:DNA-binding PadR family transcriptional regulator